MSRIRYTKTQAGTASRLGRNFLKRLDIGQLIDRNQPSRDTVSRVRIEAPTSLKKFGRAR